VPDEDRAAQTCWHDNVIPSFYNKYTVVFKFFLSVACFVVVLPKIIFDVSDADNEIDFGICFEFYSK
jgi:hypothetical protein